MQKLSRRGFLKTVELGAAALGLSGAVGSAARAATGRKPNVVLMMVDDMGFADLGCYGGEINTPALDKLAAGGMRFTQFYNTAKCSPTRAALLSGCYHREVGEQALATQPLPFSCPMDHVLPVGRGRVGLGVGAGVGAGVGVG